MSLNKERKSLSSKNLVLALQPWKKEVQQIKSRPVSISPKKVEGKQSRFKIALEILRKQQEDKCKNIKVLDKPEFPLSIHSVKRANNQRSRWWNTYQTFEYSKSWSPSSKFEIKVIL